MAQQQSNGVHAAQQQRAPINVKALDEAMKCDNSKDFAICAGCVTFIGRGTDRRVLVVHNKKYTEDIWQLPKGRRNIGEDLVQTALRETSEETGCDVEILTVINPTRATRPRKSIQDISPDLAATEKDSNIVRAPNMEPVALVSYVDPEPKEGEVPVNKVCFFFVATPKDEHAVLRKDKQDDVERLTPQWVPYADAREILTFKAEQRALELAQAKLVSSGME
ncbi:Diadenosine hexaphosphate hydrolase [Cytospora mali]|uniref:Diadenosine hexaphosphate hydrolase n=1 Tax=Cytospora mali TaxID=578113 RepID=A0A194WBG1_CYTMA|nr:Diadenosine hexaphosphate hydrolase [Valsa mali]